jgi:amino acid transporter
VVTGALTILLLVVNIGNQRVFYILTSVAIILFYIPYLMVTVPMLLRRLRGRWPTPDHGPHFSLGRWGAAVNAFAVLYGIGMTINLAWPRAAVYGSDHWYFQWGAVVFVVVIAVVGGALLLAKRSTWAGAQWTRTSAAQPEPPGEPVGE